MSAGNMEGQTGQEKKPHQIDSEKIDQILEVVSFLKNKTTDNERIVHEKCGALEIAHSELKGKVAEGLAQIESYTELVKSSDDRISHLLDRISKCEQENERVNETLTMALRKIDILESRVDLKDREFVELSTEVKDRKLIIAGVPEFVNEKIFVTVTSTINKLINTANSEKPVQGGRSDKIKTVGKDDFINAYRIGRYKDGAKRNILVFCSTNDVKYRIMTAKSLTKRSKSIKFYINDDQNLAMREYKSKLWRLNDAAVRLGLNAKVVGNKIIIEGQSYAQNELDLIPKEIIYEARQERAVPQGIAFRGEDSVFSNFYPCDIVIGGERFSSVEQYFQYCRAVDNGYALLSKKIMRTNDPKAQKMFGDRVDDKDSWIEKSEQVLYVGVYAKFAQCDELCAKLLETGSLKLFEATTDEKFGCGMGLKSEKWTTSDWNGRNAHGEILMKVRDELREKLGIRVEIEMDVPIENANDLATQTTAALDMSGNRTGQSESGQETLEGWLGQKEKEKNEYDLSFPYLAKAKSPPATQTYPIHNAYVNDRRSSKMRNRRNDAPKNRETQSRDEVKDGNALDEGRNSDFEKANNRKNEGGKSNSGTKKNERRNANGKPPVTSTPSRSPTHRQGVLSKSQKDGLRKMGVEPSSDFVKNIMKNHQFI